MCRVGAGLVQHIRGLLHLGHGVTRLGGKARRARAMAGQLMSARALRSCLREWPRDLRSWAALGVGWVSGELSLWRAASSRRAAWRGSGECLGTLGPRVGELHGQPLQRKLTDHWRGQKMGCAQLPSWEAVGNQRLDSRTLWAQNPSDGERVLGFSAAANRAHLPIHCPGPWSLPARGRGCWGCARLRSGW